MESAAGMSIMLAGIFSTEVVGTETKAKLGEGVQELAEVGKNRRSMTDHQTEEQSVAARVCGERDTFTEGTYDGWCGR